MTGRCWTSWSILACGAGGVLGLFLTAGVLHLAHVSGAFRQTLTILQGSAQTVAIFTFVIAGGVYFFKTRRATTKLRSYYNQVHLGPLFLTPYLCSLLFISLCSPAFGWDFLGHWGNVTKAFIEYLSDPVINDAVRFKYGEHHRHPRTVPYIAAWLSSGDSSLAHGQSPWLFLYISALLIFYGYSRICGLTSSQSTVVALFAGTVPLLENHVSIFGYVELFLAAVLLIAVTFISIGIRRDSVPLMLIGISVGCLAITVKNTGMAYSAVPIVSLALVFINKPLIAVIASVLLFAGIYLIFVFNNGDGFVLLENRVSLQLTNNLGWFAGHRDTFSVETAREIPKNLIYALCVNSSFHASLITACTCCLLVFRGDRSSRKSDLFVIFCIFFGIVCSAITQLTEYGYAYATPHNDSGNSRFLLPIIALMPLLVVSGLLNAEHDDVR
jgi:hypothetical protein